MKYLLWCCLMALLLSNSDGTPNHPALGEGYYLPTKNILKDSFANGADIFESLPETECVMTTPDNTMDRNMNTYANTASFYSDVGASLGLGTLSIGSAFSLSGTMSYLSVTSTNITARGSSLDIKSRKEKTSLSMNCINSKQLSKQMLADFDKLPANIPSPEVFSSWDDYKDFMEKYGSHLATSVVYGSSLIQWEVAHTSSSFSEKSFAAKACIDLFAPDVMELASVNISGPCANIDSKDKEAATRVSSSSRLTVRGASSEMQAKMQNKQSRTPDQIEKFLREGKGEEAEPIVFEWMPLYTVLTSQLKGDNSNRYIKTTNLKMFYEGMLSYGCEYLKEGDVVLRRFVRTGKSERPDYECQVRGIGCHQDSDCHFKGLGCYCYGSSCVDTDVVIYRGVIKRDRKIKFKRDEGEAKNKGVNRSCKLSIGKCKCQVGHLEPPWVTVWSYKASDAVELDEGPHKLPDHNRRSKEHHKKGEGHRYMDST